MPPPELTFAASRKKQVFTLVICLFFSVLLIRLLFDHADPTGTRDAHSLLMGLAVSGLTAGFIIGGSLRAKNPRIRKIGVITAILTYMVLYAVSLLSHFRYNDSLNFWYISGLVLFGGGGLFYAVKMVPNKAPVLSLTQTAVSVHYLYAYTLTWDQVDRLVITTQPVGYQNFVYLAVVPKPNAAQLPKVGGRGKGGDAEVLGSSYFAQLNQAPGKPADIIRQVKAFIQSNNLPIKIIEN